MSDYFALFGLKPAFDLDLKALESAYFNKQREFHPDRVAGKPEADRIHAASQSMEINEAYNTLKSPWLRARYMLNLAGIFVGTDHDTVKPSQELLLESLDMRERLAEAVSPEAFQALAAEAEQNKEQALADLSTAFAAHNNDAAAHHALRLNYLLKLLDEIRIHAKRKVV